MIAARIVFAALLTASSALAQMPVFDVDDFVAPDGGAPLFVSRLVIGGVSNLSDGYRPLGQGAGFVHVANSFYWSNFQLDYDRTETRGSDESGRTEVQTCRCSPPLYFPTPPPKDATPAAPLPGSKDTVQLAWYRRQSTVVLRSRATYTRQPIDTVVTSLLTGKEVARLSGDEQSVGLDTDVTFTIGGRRLFGSVFAVRTIRNGTTDDRAQTAVGYVARFPVLSLGKILLRTTVTLAGVSGRGGGRLNVVNPAVEAFWHEPRTETNVHLVWSPSTIRDGLRSWRTEHQIALFVDRALVAKVFGR